MNRYQGIPITKETSGKRAYVTSRYPEVPLSENDIYVITDFGDRLDILALDFYNDDSLWWIIVSANNLPGDTIYAPIGAQLRIPSNLQGVINNYRTANVNR